MAPITAPAPALLPEILRADPVQAKAFLSGLEAGYQLGAAARRPAPQEGQSK